MCALSGAVTACHIYKSNNNMGCFKYWYQLDLDAESSTSALKIHSEITYYKHPALTEAVVF